MKLDRSKFHIPMRLLESRSLPGNPEIEMRETKSDSRLSLKESLWSKSQATLLVTANKATSTDKSWQIGVTFGSVLSSQVF